MNKPKSSFEKPKGKRRRSLLTYVFGSGNKLYEEAAVEELRRDSIATDMINGSSSNWSPQDREQRSSSVTSSPVSFIPLSGPAANSAWASTSTSRGIVMEGYLTTRGGRTQKKFIDFGGDEPWERRYFTLNATSCLFIYKTRHDYRTDVRSTLYTRPLRLGDFYIEVSNSDHAERSGLPEQETYSEVSGTMSFSETAAYKTIASINNLIAPADIDIKPDRFQMILVPRENAERQSEITVLGSGASSKSVANPLHAQSSSTRYRDHWVLRCDTEEELQQWVSVMRDLCPSCFNVDNV